MSPSDAPPHRLLDARWRHDGLVTLLVGWIVALLYWSTLCPTVYWYDSAELTTAAHVLGIPHPPGYPLYVLLAHPFSYLPGDPGWRINVWSAVGGVLLAVLCVRVALALGSGAVGAGAAALVVATGSVVWSNSVIAEVYSPALAMLMLVWLVLLRGYHGRRRRELLLGAFLAGLGLGLHLFLATCGLGFAVLVARVGWHRGVPEDPAGSVRAVVKLALAAGGCTLMGALVFLWLPWRAAMDPPLNFGDPSTIERWWWVVGGGVYRQHFEQPWVASQRGLQLARLLWDQAGGVVSLFGLAGIVALVRRDRWVGAAWTLAIAGNVWFFFDYIVHDAEVFFLPAIVGCGLLVGLGVDACMRRGRILKAVGIAVFLAGWGWSTARSFLVADRGGYDQAHHWGEMACGALPPAAVLLHFTYPQEWKYNAVFAYFQVVHHRRPDVEIVEGAMSEEEIRAWLRTGRPVFAYAQLPILRAFTLTPEMEGLWAVQPSVGADPMPKR